MKKASIYYIMIFIFCFSLFSFSYTSDSNSSALSLILKEIYDFKNIYEKRINEIKTCQKNDKEILEKLVKENEKLKKDNDEIRDNAKRLFQMYLELKFSYNEKEKDDTCRKRKSNKRRSEDNKNNHPSKKTKGLTSPETPPKTPDRPTA